MNKVILYIIILILAAGLSFFLGAFILGSKLTIKTDEIRNETAAEEEIHVAAAEEHVLKGKDKTEEIVEQIEDIDTAAPERKKGAVLTFLFPPIDSEKGLQKRLSDKQDEISGIRGILSSAGTAHTSYAVNKMNDLFLFASGIISFNKILLFTANHLILIIVIPIFILISIILMIVNKDKRITPKLIIKTALFSLIIIFILPASFYLSGFAEKFILSDYISSITAAMNEKDADLIDPALNYFTIFIFTYLIIPALIVIGAVCIVIYFKKRLLTT